MGQGSTNHGNIVTVFAPLAPLGWVSPLQRCTTCGAHHGTTASCAARTWAGGFHFLVKDTGDHGRKTNGSGHPSLSLLCMWTRRAFEPGGRALVPVVVVNCDPSRHTLGDLDKTRTSLDFSCLHHRETISEVLFSCPMSSTSGQCQLWRNSKDPLDLRTRNSLSRGPKKQPIPSTHAVPPTFPPHKHLLSALHAGAGDSVDTLGDAGTTQVTLLPMASSTSLP